MSKIIRKFAWCVILVGNVLASASGHAEEPAKASFILERIVHFVDTQGTSIALEAGTYHVSRSGDVLQIITDQEQQPLLIQAEPLQIEMPVERPSVWSIMRNTDEHLIIFSDPGGQVIGISGSYSGIHSREVIPLRQRLAAKLIQPALRQLPGGNILPGVPRIKSISYFSFAQGGALVPFANVNLNIAIYNFAKPQGTRIPYKIVRPETIAGQSACTLTRNPRIGLSDSIQIDQNGEGRISLPGWFTSAGTCAVGIELQLPNGQTAGLLATPFPVESPHRYTLNQTWNLKNTLAFRTNTGAGICQGESIGPSNFPVGVINSGGDLALRIRSGPLGTECQFTSKVWVLPEGVRLVSTKWESVRQIPEGQTQGRCCAVDAWQNHCLTPAPTVSSFRFDRGTAQIIPNPDGRSESPPYYSITSANPQILEDGVILLENSSPRLVTLIKPMWCKIECTFTAINDHGFKLVLREITLEGPRGLTFP